MGADVEVENAASGFSPVINGLGWNEGTRKGFFGDWEELNESLHTMH